MKKCIDGNITLMIFCGFWSIAVNITYKFQFFNVYNKYNEDHICNTVTAHFQVNLS